MYLNIVFGVVYYVYIYIITTSMVYKRIDGMWKQKHSANGAAIATAVAGRGGGADVGGGE